MGAGEERNKFRLGMGSCTAKSPREKSPERNNTLSRTPGWLEGGTHRAALIWAPLLRPLQSALTRESWPTARAARRAFAASRPPPAAARRLPPARAARGCPRSAAAAACTTPQTGPPRGQCRGRCPAARGACRRARPRAGAAAAARGAPAPRPR
eukprot:scaffold48965_cov75-Phaeocystis_antarctica.AAC.2